MSDLINGFAAKWLPRLAGIAAGYVAGEAAKHGLTLDQEQVTALMLVAYAGVHRLISKYTNPGDATRSVLIAQDKAVVTDVGPVPATVPPAVVASRREASD